MSILDFGKPGIGKSHNPALGFALFGVGKAPTPHFSQFPHDINRRVQGFPFCHILRGDGVFRPVVQGMVITAGGKSSAWLRPGAASAPGKILLSTVSPLGDTVESMLLLLLLLL